MIHVRLVVPALLAAFTVTHPARTVLAQDNPASGTRRTPPSIDRLAVAAFSVPTPVRYSLPNGLEVLFVRDPRAPLFEARVVLRTGWRDEPTGFNGLSRLTRDVVRHGTATLTRPALDELLDSLGLVYDVGGSPGDDEGLTTTFRMSGMTAEVSNAMSLLSMTVRDPALRQGDVDAAAANMERQARQAPVGNPRTWALELARRRLGVSASARASGPVRTYTREDVARFFREHYRPGNTWLVVVGPFSDSEVRNLAAEHFGAWHPAVTGAEPSSRRFVGGDGRAVPLPGPVFDSTLRPGSRQTALVLTAAIEASAGADHAMIAVAGALLRDRLSRRAAAEGWENYNVGAPVPQFAYDRTLSLLVSVPPAQVSGVLRALRDEFAKLSSVPVSELAVDLARRTPALLRLGESVLPASMVEHVLIRELRNGDSTYWTEYATALRTTTSARFHEFASRSLATARIAIAAVGDSAGVAAAANAARR